LDIGHILVIYGLDIANEELQAIILTCLYKLVVSVLGASNVQVSREQQKMQRQRELEEKRATRHATGALRLGARRLHNN